MVNMCPVRILEKCTEGLVHLHKNNVIHRDLKPTNVLLTENKQVKISDFGLSKQLGTGRTSIHVSSRVVGTSDWTAPEILKGRNGSAYIRMSTASDVFSLGCIYYFVLTKGCHPFGDAGLRKVNILRGERELGQASGVNIMWLELIKKMTCNEPKERPTALVILEKNLFKSAHNVTHSHCCICEEKPVESGEQCQSEPQSVDSVSSTIKVENLLECLKIQQSSCQIIEVQDWFSTNKLPESENVHNFGLRKEEEKMVDRTEHENLYAVSGKKVTADPPVAQAATPIARFDSFQNRYRAPHQFPNATKRQQAPRNNTFSGLTFARASFIKFSPK